MSARIAGLALPLLVLIVPAAARSASAAIDLRVSSPAFAPGGPIPRRYTCDGKGTSPPLRWTGVPTRTRSLALSVLDPDAPGGAFVHWLTWNVPRARHGLSPRAVPPGEGRNSGGHLGYTGPCPPSGPAHHYVFRLYALDQLLTLRRGSALAAFDRALRGHVLASARLVGTYRRG